MPRPGTDPRIKQRVWDVLGSEPRSSAGAILIRVRGWAAQEKPPLVVPSERTIARLKKEFQPKTDAEKQRYGFVSWPKSLLDGSLPWEASRALCDVVFYARENGYGETTIREAEWFWRITQTAPGMDIAQRYLMARRCEALETTPNSSWTGVWEYFALTPWRSRKAQAAYDKAVKEGSIPPVPKSPRTVLKMLELEVTVSRPKKAKEPKR